MNATVRFLFEAGFLDSVPRSGYALLGLADQSVAAHTYRQSVVAFVLAQRIPEVDLGRVLTLCLFHDLPETRTGDLHHLSQRYVTVDEERVVLDQSEDLPFRDTMLAGWKEYRAASSLEARVVKDADQLELLLALRERQPDAGATSPTATEVGSWIERIHERLYLDESRKLAEDIESADPRAWWKA